MQQQRQVRGVNALCTGTADTDTVAVATQRADDAEQSCTDLESEVGRLTEQLAEAEARAQLAAHRARLRSERDGSVSPRSPSSIASGGQLVDHLNDRLIARHAEVDDALLHWQQDAEEGRFDPRLLQCLQLSTAQDNVLALRSWLAAFRSGGSGRLPKPRTTKDEEFDEAWSVLLKTLGTQTAVDF